MRARHGNQPVVVARHIRRRPGCSDRVFRDQDQGLRTVRDKQFLIAARRCRVCVALCGRQARTSDPCQHLLCRHRFCGWLIHWEGWAGVKQRQCIKYKVVDARKRVQWGCVIRSGEEMTPKFGEYQEGHGALSTSSIETAFFRRSYNPVVRSIATWHVALARPRER